jgi:cytochrome c oxidase cbb3-type subunit 4
MDITTMRIVATLVSFATFIGIFGWAWMRSNRAGFDEAARLPFEQDADEATSGPAAPIVHATAARGAEVF